MRPLRFAALTSDFVGTLLLVVSVLLVHRRIEKEGRIDSRVTREIRSEFAVAIAALVLIVAAFALLLVDEFTSTEDA